MSRPTRSRPYALFGLCLVVAVAVALVLASPRGGPPPPQLQPVPTLVASNATVARIVDGDTVSVRIGNTTEPVRLLGVDTPETVDDRKPVQCFGREASARTAALLPVGTPVRLERDIEARDQYGRVLAYVYRASDGLFVNLALVQEGFATVLVIEPNHAFASQLRDAERAAKAAALGLWGSCGGPGVPESATTTTTPRPAASGTASSPPG